MSQLTAEAQDRNTQALVESGALKFVPEHKLTAEALESTLNALKSILSPAMQAELDRQPRTGLARIIFGK